MPNKHTYIHALITNHHVINENTIKKGIPFKIEFNNNKENRIIKINKDRKVYTNSEYNITIIEIKENDGICNFLELDENINNSYILVKSKIYFLFYLGNESNGRFSFGMVKEIKGYQILHDCSSGMGSSGGPILSLNTNKVIGIHLGSMIDKSINFGSLLNQAVSEFLSNYFK